MEHCQVNESRGLIEDAMFGPFNTPPHGNQLFSTLVMFKLVGDAVR